MTEYIAPASAVTRAAAAQQLLGTYTMSAIMLVSLELTCSGLRGVAQRLCLLIPPTSRGTFAQDDCCDGQVLRRDRHGLCDKTLMCDLCRWCCRQSLLRHYQHVLSWHVCWMGMYHMATNLFKQVVNHLLENNTSDDATQVPRLSWTPGVPHLFVFFFC